MDIYGTIGPACADSHLLTEMIRNGMTGIRLNASHGTLKQSEPWIHQIHDAVKAAGTEDSFRLLLDLQGPELRVKKFPEGVSSYVIEEGDTIAAGVTGSENCIGVPEVILPCLHVGQQILLDDGKLLLEVTEKTASQTAVFCKVLRGGTLWPEKSIALPGIEVQNDTLTEEDYQNIAELRRYGVTDVMLPFVRGRKDIRNLRFALEQADAGKVRIHAKIENRRGLEKLDEILEEADAVVIARGDLGNAMPLWKLPVAQKQIARKCIARSRPFMVVTQMLASMEQAKVPTRAEVLDIFNAVLDGADSVMLTGETAVGRYPAEAIRYMANTVREAEKYRMQKTGEERKA